MRFQDILGPPSHLYAGPWVCKVRWDFFPFYLQAHEISGVSLDLLHIYMKAHQFSGSPWPSN